MGLTRNEVIKVVTSLAKYFKEAREVKDFVVIGGASLLLRGINVETEDIDIIVKWEKTPSLNFFEAYFEQLKEKCIKDNLVKKADMDGYNIFLDYNLHGKIIEVALYTPWYFHITDIENFDVIDINGNKIEVRKLESLREDMRKQVKWMMEYEPPTGWRSPFRVDIKERISAIRAKANRIKKLLKSGVFP